MSTLKQLQEDVDFRMRRGDTFASVETQVIDASGLSDAEKAALWLYGWSFVNFRLQRREAVAHIDVLAATPTSAQLPDTRLRLV
jgi:hypothetical protein